MKQFIIVVGIALILCSQAFAQVTNKVLVPLTWVGRSTESSGTVPSGPSIGSAVAAGLALPLNPNQVIFDNGAYHAPSAPVTNGADWASWPQYGPGFSSWEVRHFQANFTLPAGLHNVVGFTLFSPYYTQYGDVIPINDNAYFYLNGTSIGAKGVDYGGINNLPIYETDGWNADGKFGSAPVGFLQSGLNVLDIVTEERLFGGGMGRLNVALLDVVPEPQSVVLVGGGLLALVCLIKRQKPDNGAHDR